MQSLRLVAVIGLPLLTLLGCASTTVSDRQEFDTREKIARPGRIIVYDFASTPGGVAPDSALYGQYSESSPPMTAEQMEAGRQLGASVTRELISEISAMGLTAVPAGSGPPPQIGDLVIRGYFVSIDEGSVAKRLVVGFGSGAANLKTMVEGYLVTEHGVRKLGSGMVDSGGGKSPGLAVPLVVTLATANPIGLVVGGAVKVAGEATGSATIEGSGKRTAEEIAKELRVKFQEEGWIE